VTWKTALCFIALAACGDDGATDGGSGDSGGPRDAAIADAARDAGDVEEAGTDAGGTADAGSDASGVAVEPPLGGSSGGSGGGPASGEERTTAGGVRYNLLVPASYRDGTPAPLLVVFSGVEGATTMMNNLRSAGPAFGLGDFLLVVLDGRTSNALSGAAALDDVRMRYDVDNDRTLLLSESAGTRAGLQLGFELRQSFFAAFWANDVNASGTPAGDAASLGFAPWGNAGPGGDFPDANAIVAGMRAAGYRIEEPAPYDGPGSGTHGSSEQFLAALRWLAASRSRR
jgi:hypothetical protein